MSERKIVNRCECHDDERKPIFKQDAYKTEICETCYEVISYELPSKTKSVIHRSGPTKASKKERVASVDDIKLPSEDAPLPKRDLSFEINKVYLEKCEATMSRMKDGEVDYTFTSPPYNVSQDAFAKYENYSDDLTQQEYLEWLIKIIDELLRVTKNHVFFNIQELANNRISIDSLMYHYRYKLKEKFIWVKDSGSQATNHRVCSCRWEYIWCLSNNNPLYKMFEDVGSFSDWTNVIKVKTTKNIHAKDHKAVFPLNLPRKFIEKFGKEGDIWYDPFMGTGTTARAAILAGRNYVGSEMGKTSHKIALKEIQKTKDTPMLDLLGYMDEVQKPKVKTKAIDEGGKHKQIILDI